MAGNNLNGWQLKVMKKKEFRDVEAFDANTAIIMAVDSPGIILKNKRWRQNMEGSFS